MKDPLLRYRERFPILNRTKYTKKQGMSMVVLPQYGNQGDVFSR
jgi:hypothetical protein